MRGSFGCTLKTVGTPRAVPGHGGRWSRRRGSLTKQLAESAAETAALLDGMLHFFASPEASPGYARFLADWATHTGADCADPTVSASDSLFSSPPWHVAAFTYDCVVSLAIAASRAVDSADGAEVAARFREVRFDGATGSVAFDSHADREASSPGAVEPSGAPERSLSSTASGSERRV